MERATYLTGPGSVVEVFAAAVLRVGAFAVPINVTAGDLTATRAVIGTDAAIPAATALFMNGNLTLGAAAIVKGVDSGATVRNILTFDGSNDVLILNAGGSGNEVQILPQAGAGNFPAFRYDERLSGASWNVIVDATGKLDTAVGAAAIFQVNMTATPAGASASEYRVLNVVAFVNAAGNVQNNTATSTGCYITLRHLGSGTITGLRGVAVDPRVTGGGTVTTYSAFAVVADSS